MLSGFDNDLQLIELAAVEVVGPFYNFKAGVGVPTRQVLPDLGDGCDIVAIPRNDQFKAAEVLNIFEVDKSHGR